MTGDNHQSITDNQPQTFPPDSGAAENTIFICGLCNKIFVTESHIAEHLKTHVPTSTFAALEASNLTPRRTLTASPSAGDLKLDATVCTLKVDLCSAPFASEATALSPNRVPEDVILSRELSRDNEHINVLWLSKATGNYRRKVAFECRICARHFRYRLAASDHVNQHTNQRPYKCHYCSVACRSSPARSLHERRKHADKLAHRPQPMRQRKSRRSAAIAAAAAVAAAAAASRDTDDDNNSEDEEDQDEDHGSSEVPESEIDVDDDMYDESSVDGEDSPPNVAPSSAAAEPEAEDPDGGGRGSDVDDGGGGDSIVGGMQLRMHQEPLRQAQQRRPVPTGISPQQPPAQAVLRSSQCPICPATLADTVQLSQHMQLHRQQILLQRQQQQLQQQQQQQQQAAEDRIRRSSMLAPARPVYPTVVAPTAVAWGSPIQAAGRLQRGVHQLHQRPQPPQPPHQQQQQQQQSVIHYFPGAPSPVYQPQHQPQHQMPVRQLQHQQQQQQPQHYPYYPTPYYPYAAAGQMAQLIRIRAGMPPRPQQPQPQPQQQPQPPLSQPPLPQVQASVPTPRRPIPTQASQMQLRSVGKK